MFLFLKGKIYRNFVRLLQYCNSYVTSSYMEYFEKTRGNNLSKGNFECDFFLWFPSACNKSVNHSSIQKNSWSAYPAIWQAESVLNYKLKTQFLLNMRFFWKSQLLLRLILGKKHWEIKKLYTKNFIFQ